MDGRQVNTPVPFNICDKNETNNLIWVLVTGFMTHNFLTALNNQKT